MYRDDEEYLLGVLRRQFSYFGPFPAKIQEVCSEETVHSILCLMSEFTPEQMTPFARTTEREVVKWDKDFIGKIMKLDWRDRPTANESLEDEWGNDDENQRLWLLHVEYFSNISFASL